MVEGVNADFQKFWGSGWSERINVFLVKPSEILKYLITGVKDLEEGIEHPGSWPTCIMRQKMVESSEIYEFNSLNQNGWIRLQSFILLRA